MINPLYHQDDICLSLIVGVSWSDLADLGKRSQNVSTTIILCYESSVMWYFIKQFRYYLCTYFGWQQGNLSHYTIVYNLEVLHWMKWQKKPLIGWLGDTETASIMLHLFCSSGGFISHRICIISGLETIFLLAPEMRQYRETGTHFSLSHSHKIFIIKRQKYLLFQISKYLKWTKTLQY